MLKILRSKKLKKRIFYILAVIIIPAFMFWGSAAVMKNKGERTGYAGKIFGRNIPYTQYQDSQHALRVQLKLKFGDNAYQVEKLIDMDNDTWNRLILGYEANRRNIKVSDKELSDYITNLNFLKKDGLFDPRTYDVFLKYSINTPARKFEEEIRQDIKSQKVFDQITQKVSLTENDIKEGYRQENEQVMLRYINILFGDIKKETNLSDTDIKEYYNTHKDMFKIPIQVNLEYIGTDYPKEATQEQKDKIYKNIEDIQAFLSNTNDIPKAKDKFSATTGETGFFYLSDKVEGFGPLFAHSEELFNLKKDEVSNIIITGRGPYIFKLKDKRIDYIPNLEEIKDKVKDSLLTLKSKDAAKEKIDKLYKQIDDKKKANPSTGLSQIAKELKITLKETEFFTKNTPAKDIGPSKEFNDTALSLKDGEISKIIELPRGYYIIEVAQRKKIDEEKFNKEKDEFTKKLLEQRKNETFEEFFTNLKKEARLESYIKPQPK